MAFTLSEVVPWGRSYDEYISMFTLSSQELKGKILGCSDGPASFNSILAANGGSIISVDPVYAFSPEEINKRIEETSAAVLDQTRKKKVNLSGAISPLWRNWEEFACLPWSSF